MNADKKAYLWHMSNQRWETAMEAVDYDETTPPKDIKAVHKKFIRERDRRYKKGGKIHRKNARMDSERQEE